MQTHGLEHLLGLALGKSLAVGQFHTHGLGTLATARQASVPAQGRILTLAPVVVPAIIRRYITVAEVVGVDQVFGLHLVGGVLDAARFLTLFARPFIVGKCLGQRVHAGVATHADRKSTRLNSSHSQISYAVFCLKKKN